jgi:hypothetical protein
MGCSTSLWWLHISSPSVTVSLYVLEMVGFKKINSLVLVIDLTKNVSHVMLVLLFASSLCSLVVKDLLEHMHVGGTRRPTP